MDAHTRKLLSKGNTELSSIILVCANSKIAIIVEHMGVE